MKCLPTWDEEKTMGVLAKLPEPFSEISSYGKRPKLEDSTINYNFTVLLKNQGFISSFKQENGLIKISTFKSSDHVE